MIQAGFRKSILYIGLVLVASILVYSHAQARKTKKKKRVIYRSHTSVDLSGASVQGKVRTPEVFYIFQRKRSESHDIIHAPVNLSHQRSPTVSRLKGALPK